MKNQENEKENTYELKHLTRDDVRNLLKTNLDIIVGNVEKIMKEKGITQEALACAMRSEQQHVSYILRKKGKGITINVVGRIASALNTSISELTK